MALNSSLKSLIGSLTLVGFCAASCFKGASRILLLHLSPLLLWEIMCSSEVNCKCNKYLELGFFAL